MLIVLTGWGEVLKRWKGGFQSFFCGWSGGISNNCLYRNILQSYVDYWLLKEQLFLSFTQFLVGCKCSNFQLNNSLSSFQGY